MRALLGVAVICVLSACVTTPERIGWQDPVVDLVWPKPPETARIRYLRSLSGVVDFKKSDKGSRFLRWLTGEEEQQGGLVAPYGVAADGNGRIWVADTGAAMVQLIDLARRRVDYIEQAGSLHLQSPVGVAVDLPRQRLYVTDSVLQKLLVFDLNGRPLAEFAPEDGFGRPVGLAVDGVGQLYVVDTLKAQVYVFSPAGKVLRTLVSGAAPDFSFKLPLSVAVDASGRVFVVDSMNFRIEIFDPSGKSLGTFGQIGDVPGAFARPRGIAVDSDGHVYVSDGIFDNLQIFDGDGHLLLYWGGTGTDPGHFSLPAGLCFDPSNRLYVADVYNHRIQVFEYIPVAP